MIGAPGKSREKSPHETKLKLEEARDEIHDYLVLSHWKHS
jgi:hypothetical protein